jgi:BASS family bile acid:Na+ symporter
MRQIFRKICLWVAGVALLILAADLVLQRSGIWQIAAVVAMPALAIGLGGIPTLKGYQFTAWIIAAVTCAMIFPATFLRVGDLDLRNKWLILFIVQAVMFGMGTQMKLADFAGVAKMPWAVFVGVFGQFTIMPLVGFALTKVFHFENPEIAAGIILIGSCSAGLASNVMAYIAKANLALSITMTSVTTMLAPLMTPLWMKILAGELVEVKAFAMMMEIIKMVIVPIGAALLHDYLTFAKPAGRRLVHMTTAVGIAWLGFIAFGGWKWIAEQLTLPSLPAAGQAQAIHYSPLLPWFGVIGFLFAAVIIGVLYNQVVRIFPRVAKWMPVLSMAGIVYFTTVTTAVGRENLVKVGGLLFLAAALHNTFGYVFAYWLARVGGLDKNSCRTVAFEVGLQNGGMASGLAGAAGKLGTMGLAAAIFSPWMNISGSILANYWRKRPVEDGNIKNEKLG